MDRVKNSSHFHVFQRHRFESCRLQIRVDIFHPVSYDIIEPMSFHQQFTFALVENSILQPLLVPATVRVSLRMIMTSNLVQISFCQTFLTHFSVTRRFRINANKNNWTSSLLIPIDSGYKHLLHIPLSAIYTGKRIPP